MFIPKKGIRICFIILALAAFSLFLFQRAGNSPVDSPPAAGPDYSAFDFTLSDHLGLETRLSDFQGKVVLILFGYTSCPDICPTQLSLLTEVMDKLGELSGELQVLFITVDPERDTPKKLQEYLANFHPNFMGLTGRPEELLRVARQYNAAFSRGEALSNGYKMDHSSSVYLVNQKGHLAGIYPNDVAPDRMVEEIIKVVDSRGLKGI
ncbi:MAG: SCO family protein [Nitrospinae bacterium]|nr:SCO family protein [Nitrospinota bacterium]